MVEYMSVTNLEIEAFKYQLYAESLGLFDDDSPATYAIILKHFGDDLSEEQLNMLNYSCLSSLFLHILYNGKQGRQTGRK